MKTPFKPGEPEMDPPPCLTNDTNDPIPREYIEKWKVTEGNKEQRMKEIVYTLNMLKSKGMNELVLNSKTYERDFFLLSKGIFKNYNSKLTNRQLLLQTVLDNGLAELLDMYWDAIIVEFEVKRRGEEEGTSTGMLWRIYTESQKHITGALHNLYASMIVFWNGSDMKDVDRLKQIYDKTVGFIIKALGSYLHPLEVESTHPQHKLAKAFLGTLHNLCNKYDECIPDLRSRDALQIVAKYRNHGTSTLKTKSILVASYLLTEKDAVDSSVIVLDENDITFMIKVLDDALHSTGTTSKKYGYHAEEIITGLDNIAVVDRNKKALVDAGVLPMYVEAMAFDKPTLQENAAKAIWTLAFDDENLKKVKAETGCVNELRTLACSEIPHVKAAAEGALWKLEGETAHLERRNAQPASKEKSTKKLQHVMLSYQWDVKPAVLKLRQRLKNEGYRVWIDVEQMTGNTSKSMAAAVENAAVFVPVLTEKYKASPAARQEAEYANFLQKKKVPVRLQPKYRPDGWLGFLLGSTYFYDLSKSEEYEQKVVDFLKALGEDGKIQPGEDENPDQYVDEEETVISNPLMSTRPEPVPPILQKPDTTTSLSSTSSFDFGSLSCLSWSCKQVSDWLIQNKLGKYTDSLKEIDGELLAELISMRFVSPDVYYEIMRQEHDMMTLDLLRFNSATRNLAKSCFK